MVNLLFYNIAPLNIAQTATTSVAAPLPQSPCSASQVTAEGGMAEKMPSVCSRATVMSGPPPTAPSHFNIQSLPQTEQFCVCHLKPSPLPTHLQHTQVCLGYSSRKGGPFQHSATPPFSPTEQKTRWLYTLLRSFSMPFFFFWLCFAVYCLPDHILFLSLNSILTSHLPRSLLGLH